MTKLFFKTTKSPVGELQLFASDKGLAAILWENDKPNRVRLGESTENNNHLVLLKAEHQFYWASSEINSK